MDNLTFVETQEQNDPVSKSRRSILSLERRFHRALGLYAAGRLREASHEIEFAIERAENIGEVGLFVESCVYWLRILAELEKFESIKQIEERVKRLFLSAPPEDIPPTLRVKILYTLGICHCYQDNRYDQAMAYFREAVDLAMQEGDKAVLAYPLYGIATVLYARSQFDEALSEVERLGVLLNSFPNADLNSASWLLKALITRNRGDLDGSMKAAWKAFECLRQHPRFVLYLHTTVLLAQLHALRKETPSARAYIDLVARVLNRDDYPRVARLFDDVIDLLGPDGDAKMELTFDYQAGILKGPAQNTVRFDGQFVLRDLLYLFLKSPGHVFSKSDLARAVWNEPYQPQRHDNKIYVTIKRLRQLIEPSTRAEDDETAFIDRIEYIMRDKAGYYLNPKIRVRIEGRSEGGI